MNKSCRKLTKFLWILLLALSLDIYFIHRQLPTASAQSDGEEPNPIVESYAEAFSLAYEEAQRRLQLQAEMDALEARVREGELSYAGSWTQHEPGFGLVIAFTSPDAEVLIKPYLDDIAWADLVQVQQARYTMAELDSIFEQVTQAARETKLHFEAGANYRTGKVDMYTPEPDELRSQLEATGAIDAYRDVIEYNYQESMSAPAQSKYPYLPGGHQLSTCTTGLVLARNSDGRRFMSTSGHCSNNQYAQYNGTDDVYVGPVVFENDPEHNIGIYGDDIDLQVHDVSARSLDLTNVVRTGATTTVKISAAELKATTHNDYVCKHGRISGQTCGLVTNLNYAPGGVYGASDDYVRVDKIAGAIGDMACPSDSGSPVYKYEIGGVWGLGVLSGREAADCTGNNVDFYFYTPTDEINRAGFSVLTTHHQQRYLQNVFWTETSCVEYRTPYDDDGNPILPSSSQPCSTYAPGSGTIETYTGWVAGNYWREGMWRGGIGYVRNVPLSSNGAINWSAAPAWTQCCSGAAPRSQDAYIVGNHYYQNVFWSETSCIEYRRSLDDNGNAAGTQTSQPCRTTAPGIGIITSYTAYVVGGRLREGIWRGGIGYIRDVPLNSTNTDINWAAAPAWQQCCSSGTPPRAQGGDVLSYP